MWVRKRYLTLCRILIYVILKSILPIFHMSSHVPIPREVHLERANKDMGHYCGDSWVHWNFNASLTLR